MCSAVFGPQQVILLVDNTTQQVFLLLIVVLSSFACRPETHGDCRDAGVVEAGAVKIVFLPCPSQSRWPTDCKSHPPSLVITILLVDSTALLQSFLWLIVVLPSCLMNRGRANQIKTPPDLHTYRQPDLDPQATTSFFLIYWGSVFWPCQH